MYFVFIVLNICYLNFALTFTLFLGGREWNVTNRKQIRDEMAKMKDEKRAKGCNIYRFWIDSSHEPR
jgi:hypothetical protein